jgi:hypothetical protein
VATVTQGQDIQYQANVWSLDGFGDSVSVSVSGVPPGTLVGSSSPVIGSGIAYVPFFTGLSTPLGTYPLTFTGTSGSGAVSHTAQSTLTIAPAVCSTATPRNGWQNTSLPTLTGLSQVFFDAMPTASPTNSVIGLSSGPQTAYTGFAELVRFNPSGTIDVRNGSVYAADAVMPYSAGTTYHFTVNMDLNAHTYTVLAFTQLGAGQQIATNYAFRTEQSSVTSVSSWGVEVNPDASGSTVVCNFALPED